MHLEVKLQLQKIDSEAYDNIHPAELDLFLNRVQRRFYNVRLDKFSNDEQKGFEEILKRLFDLSKVVVPELEVPAYKTTGDDWLYIYFPVDHIWTIDGRAKIYKDCTDQTYTFENETQNYFALTFNDSAATSPFYDDLTIEQNGSPLFDAADYPNYIGAITDKDEKFVVIETVVELINTIDGFSCTWERWRDVYQKNSFIIIDEENQYGADTFTLNLGGSAVDTETVQTFTGSVVDAASLGSTEKAPLILKENQEGSQNDLNPYRRTRENGVKMTAAGGGLKVFYSKRFILKRALLTYIRKPRNINIYSSQDCELNEQVHHEIVDLTAQHIRSVIENKAYQIHEHDLTKSE